MSEKNSISLTAATLICINTMIGAGLFINPRQVTFLAGPFGFLGYLASACIILPLILTVAELARLQPVSGGLYMYSRAYLSPAWGFLSGWSYFVSKSTSVALFIHTINKFFQSRVSLLQDINILLLDYTVIALITLLCAIGVSVGGRVQYLFIAMKLIPISAVFVAGFLAFDNSFFSQASSSLPSLDAFASLVPICLYALIGFEIICAVGGFVVDPEKNVRRAILRAFCVIAALTFSFQLLMYGSLGPLLASAPEPILSLLQKAFSLPWVGNIINGIVFASISGSAFSIIASNCWNMQALGTYGSIPFGSAFARLSRFKTPVAALALQAVVCATMVTITREQIPLQNMTIFGLFTSFLLTACAAIAARKKERMQLPAWVAPLAIVSCCYVLGICLRNMCNLGISVAFLAVFSVGCVAVFLRTLFAKLRKN